MIDREFKNIDELLDFALTECGDMEYNIQKSAWTRNLELILNIKKGFNLERIYYALYLSKKLIGIEILGLNISELNLIDSDLEGGWLEKMEIKELFCY